MVEGGIVLGLVVFAASVVVSVEVVVLEECLSKATSWDDW